MNNASKENLFYEVKKNEKKTHLNYLKDWKQTFFKLFNSNIDQYSILKNN